ncbi:MAG: hypothetical protein F9K47_06925 [Burkholderiales bacterium]|nr:MAG: hypothetical protein F9K47_06925 [Burkholderiales bacterium]
MAIDRPLVLRGLASLPQAAHLEASKSAWVDALECQEPTAAQVAAVLHGLEGFSAGDLGVLVAERVGHGTRFFGRTASRVVQEKLLQAPPRLDRVSQREAIYKPICRDLFFQQYQASPLRWRRNAPSGARAWFQVQPEDLVVVEGRVYAVQYEFPTRTDAAIAFEDRVALHCVAEAVAAGQVTDGGSHLHSEQWPDGLLHVRWNAAKAQIEVHPVDLDRSLIQEILDAGAEAWAQVCAGQVPEQRAARQLATASQPQIGEEMAGRARELLGLRMLQGVLDRREAQTKEGFIELARRFDWSDGAGGIEIHGALKVAQGAMEYDLEGLLRAIPESERQRCEEAVGYDTTGLVALVQSLGGDPERAAKSAYSLSRVLAVAQENGVAIEDFGKGHFIEVAVTPARKGPAAEVKEMYRTAATAAVEEATQKMAMVGTALPAGRLALVRETAPAEINF